MTPPSKPDGFVRRPSGVYQYGLAYLNPLTVRLSSRPKPSPPGRWRGDNGATLQQAAGNGRLNQFRKYEEKKLNKHEAVSY
jgi:hypothetical protein